MRAIFLAAISLAVLTTAASAQMGGRSSGGADHAPLPERPKVDEKAYKAAMERVPEAKQKYDPWGGVAPAPAPAASAKKK